MRTKISRRRSVELGVSFANVSDGNNNSVSSYYDYYGGTSGLYSKSNSKFTNNSFANRLVIEFPTNLY